jgi:tRNA pseudouridine55 synthase
VTTTQKAEPHGLLLVDKCLGPTSHDVVAVARRALGTRAVGHTGTLDPTASGLLVVVVGEATKLVNMLAAGEKRYEATIQLGSETHTLDAGGEVLATREVPALTRADVEQAAQRFLGEISQRAPLVSAIKVDGKRLHKRTRAGEVVEAPVRQVRVDALEIEAFDGARISLNVRCGKGFYVRALARDLALALGTLGHLSALRRTHNAGLSVDAATGFDDLRAAARGSEEQREAVRARLLPLPELCQRLPHACFDAASGLSLRHGRTLALSDLTHLTLPVEDEFIALSEDQRPLAIVARSVEGVRVVRGFHGT